MDNLDFQFKVLLNVFNCNQDIKSRLQYGEYIVILETYGLKFRSHTILIIINDR